jgi:hypothetical protein
VADAFLGVQDGPGRHERVLEDHRQETPRAVHQLCQPWLHQDRHVRVHRDPDARGRRQQPAQGPAAAAGWADRQVLRRGHGSAVRVMWPRAGPRPACYLRTCKFVCCIETENKAFLLCAAFGLISNK